MRRGDDLRLQMALEESRKGPAGTGTGAGAGAGKVLKKKVVSCPPPRTRPITAHPAEGPLPITGLSSAFLFLLIANRLSCPDVRSTALTFATDSS